MIGGALIIAALVALAVVGRIARMHHRHHVAEADFHAAGVDHVGTWEICSCKAARMTGDTRWRRHPAAFLKH